MNVFAVDSNPITAAISLCDQHVVKMATETAQILSDAIRIKGKEGPCKPFNMKHPSPIWASQSSDNFMWLLTHGVALCTEYSKRYCGKRHAAGALIIKCRDIYSSEFTVEFIESDWQMARLIYVGLPEFKHQDALFNYSVVQSYRNLYNKDKSRFARWRHSLPPEWYEHESK